MSSRSSTHDKTNETDRNQCQVCKHLWPDGPKTGIFAPCWNCLLIKGADGQPLHVVWPGCRRCYIGLLQDLACRRCGSWLMPHGLIWHGQQLPEAQFDKYPAGWRLEYWAVHGAPHQQLLPHIRAHLRVRYSDKSPTRLEFVNFHRKEMGLERLMPPPESEEAEQLTDLAQVIESIGRKAS